MINPRELPNDLIPSQKKWMFLLLNTGKGNGQIENKGDLFKYSCLTKISVKVTNIKSLFFKFVTCPIYNLLYHSKFCSVRKLYLF